MTHRSFRASTSLLLAVGLLFGSAQGLANPFGHRLSGPSVRRAGKAVGLAARGGVEVCYTPASETTDFELTHGDGILQSRTAWDSVRLEMTEAELRDVAKVAVLGSQRCLEVSVDPVMDERNRYYAPQLREGPSFAEALMSLDHQVGFALAGELSLPPDLGHLLPQRQARSLLTTDIEYQSFAVSMLRAPHHWHSTTVRVHVDRRARPQLDFDIQPSAAERLPDGRSIRIKGALAQVANRPFEPLATAIEESPSEMAKYVPRMPDSIRMVRAYALMKACLQRNERCARVVRGWAAGPKSTSMGTIQPWVGPSFSVSGLIRAAILEKVWAEHRATVPSRTLEPDQRIIMFIDEVLYGMLDLRRASMSALVGELEEARPGRWLVGLDRARIREEYAGLVDLAYAVLLTWRGSNLQQSVDAFDKALTTAEEAGDVHSRLLVLRSYEDLIAVLALRAQSGDAEGRIPTLSMPSDRYGLSKGEAAPARLALHQIALELPKLRREVEDLAFDHFEAELATLERRPASSLYDALELLGRFQRSQLYLKTRATQRPVAALEIRLRAKVARMAWRASNPDEAHDHVRMIASIIEVSVEPGSPAAREATAIHESLVELLYERAPAL